jgi:uncharacterized membrane-anchored protein YitT (DUF2179 family)
MGEPHKPKINHSLLEDAQAFLLGTALCALGLQFVTHLGLITGQTAGLAVLLTYVSGQSLGLVFLLVNLPFWGLSWFRMGPRFTVKSIIAVAVLSAMTEVLPGAIVIGHLSAPVGAALSGALIGMGLSCKNACGSKQVGHNLPLTPSCFWRPLASCNGTWSSGRFWARSWST